MPFGDCNSNKDTRRDEARDKVRKYVELKNNLQEADEDANHKQTVDNSSDGDQECSNLRHVSEFVKASGYESDYISSLDPGSYEDTSEGSDIEGKQRYRSSRKMYDHSVPLEDFFLDLRFKDLKLFKNELVDFFVRKGFEFRYVKNDYVRIRAMCSGKNCKWLILYSWCSGSLSQLSTMYRSILSFLIPLETGE